MGPCPPACEVSEGSWVPVREKASPSHSVRLRERWGEGELQVLWEGTWRVCFPSGHLPREATQEGPPNVRSQLRVLLLPGTSLTADPLRNLRECSNSFTSSLNSEVRKESRSEWGSLSLLWASLLPSSAVWQRIQNHQPPYSWGWQCLL